MSRSIQQYIASRIQQRIEENNFRSLKVLSGFVDFYSNDYLGFARDKTLAAAVEEEVKQNLDFTLGSTGSRLLSGNSSYAQALEDELAAFYKAENALLFNSGFVANYGLLSSLPYRGDTIIYDELVHASIHDGIRNSRAESVNFKHNDLNDLRGRLESAKGLKYVVVESVYSMDGDFAPLAGIVELCQKYDAGLIVDEAHATGLYGANGEGRVVELGLQQYCLARIATFGKSIGTHGAVVLCSSDLKTFLINYCRPFIFSTSLPFHNLASIRCAHKLLPKVEDRRVAVFNLVKAFRNEIKLRTGFELIDSASPIQSIVVSGNSSIKQFAGQIQNAGFDVRPILAPTVARGKERIRICIHSFNTGQEVTKLAQVINTL